MNEEQYNKLMRSVKIMEFENHLQTIFVLMAFFFGVQALSDISKKLK